MSSPSPVTMMPYSGKPPASLIIKGKNKKTAKPKAKIQKILFGAPKVFVPKPSGNASKEARKFLRNENEDERYRTLRPPPDRRSALTRRSALLYGKGENKENKKKGKKNWNVVAKPKHDLSLASLDMGESTIVSKHVSDKKIMHRAVSQDDASDGMNAEEFLSQILSQSKVEESDENNYHNKLSCEGSSETNSDSSSCNLPSSSSDASSEWDKDVQSTANTRGDMTYTGGITVATRGTVTDTFFKADTFPKAWSGTEHRNYTSRRKVAVFGTLQREDGLLNLNVPLEFLKEEEELKHIENQENDEGANDRGREETFHSFHQKVGSGSHVNTVENDNGHGQVKKEQIDKHEIKVKEETGSFNDADGKFDNNSEMLHSSLRSSSSNNKRRASLRLNLSPPVLWRKKLDKDSCTSSEPKGNESFTYEQDRPKFNNNIKNIVIDEFFLPSPTLFLNSSSDSDLSMKVCLPNYDNFSNSNLSTTEKTHELVNESSSKSCPLHVESLQTNQGKKDLDTIKALSSSCSSPPPPPSPSASASSPASSTKSEGKNDEADKEKHDNLNSSVNGSEETCEKQSQVQTVISHSLKSDSTQHQTKSLPNQPHGDGSSSSFSPIQSPSPSFGTDSSRSSSSPVLSPTSHPSCSSPTECNNDCSTIEEMTCNVLQLNQLPCMKTPQTKSEQKHPSVVSSHTEAIHSNDAVSKLDPQVTSSSSFSTIQERNNVSPVSSSSSLCSNQILTPKEDVCKGSMNLTENNSTTSSILFTDEHNNEQQLEFPVQHVDYEPSSHTEALSPSSALSFSSHHSSSSSSYNQEQPTPLLSFSSSEHTPTKEWPSSPSSYTSPETSPPPHPPPQNPQSITTTTRHLKSLLRQDRIHFHAGLSKMTKHPPEYDKAQSHLEKSLHYRIVLYGKHDFRVAVVHELLGNVLSQILCILCEERNDLKGGEEGGGGGGICASGEEDYECDAVATLESDLYDCMVGDGSNVERGAIGDGNDDVDGSLMEGERKSSPRESKNYCNTHTNDWNVTESKAEVESNCKEMDDNDGSTEEEMKSEAIFHYESALKALSYYDERKVIQNENHSTTIMDEQDFDSNQTETNAKPNLGKNHKKAKNDEVKDGLDTSNSSSMEDDEEANCAWIISNMIERIQQNLVTVRGLLEFGEI